MDPNQTPERIAHIRKVESILRNAMEQGKQQMQFEAKLLVQEDNEPEVPPLLQNTAGTTYFQLSDSDKQNLTHIQVLTSSNQFEASLPVLLFLNNTIDSSGSSIWHHLCSYNNPLVRLLLKEDRYLNEINVVNTQGLRPIEVAAMYCEYDIVKVMWEKGARGKVLYWAARGGNAPTLPVGDFTDSKGNSAVHYAAENDQVELLQLIQKKDGPKALYKRNKRGVSPLAMAFECNSYGAAHYLLAYAGLGAGNIEPKDLQLIQTTSSLHLQKLYSQFAEIRREQEERQRRADHNMERQLGESIPKPSLWQIGTRMVSSNWQFCRLVVCQLAIGCAMVYESMLALLVVMTVGLGYMIEDMEGPQMSSGRQLEFKSCLFKRKVRFGAGHKYLLAFYVTVLLQGATLFSIGNEGWVPAALNLVGLFLTAFGLANLVIHVFAVSQGLTPAEMFDRIQCPYLYRGLHISKDGYAYHSFKNPFHHGVFTNLATYNQFN